MNNWKVIPTIVVATVLIFGAGVMTGGILVNCAKQARPRMADKHPNQAAPVNPPPTNNNPAPAPSRPPQIWNKDFVRRLEGEMTLTKEEHETIQKIIDENQNLMRKMIQDARLEIREALPPGQRQQFDELMKRPLHKPLLNTNAPPKAAVAASTNAP